MRLVPMTPDARTEIGDEIAEVHATKAWSTIRTKPTNPRRARSTETIPVDPVDATGQRSSRRHI